MKKLLYLTINFIFTIICKLYCIF